MPSKRKSPEVRSSPGPLAVEVRLEIHGGPVCARAEVPDVPTRLADVVPPAQALAEKIIECVSDSTAESITCRKGCTTCCRYLVPLSVPEALAILDEIDRAAQSQGPGLRRRFLYAANKLTSSAAVGRGHLSGCDPKNLSRWYQSLAVDCPFLRGEICAIYPTRPIACREHLTTDPVELCRDPQSGRGRTITMPFSVSQALAELAARMEQGPLEAVMLPLVLPWAEANRSRGQRTWPAEQVYGEFAAICRSLAAASDASSPKGPAQSAA